MQAHTPRLPMAREVAQEVTKLVTAVSCQYATDRRALNSRRATAFATKA